LLRQWKIIKFNGVFTAASRNSSTKPQYKLNIKTEKCFIIFTLCQKYSFKLPVKLNLFVRKNSSGFRFMQRFDSEELRMEQKFPMSLSPGEYAWSFSCQTARDGQPYCARVFIDKKV